MKYATFDERQSTGKNRVKVYSYSTDSLLQKRVCIFVGNEFLGKYEWFKDKKLYFNIILSKDKMLFAIKFAYLG